MYINDVPIYMFLVAIVLGYIIGYSLELINKKIINNEKLFDKKNGKDFLKNFLKPSKTNLINTIVLIVLFVAALLRFSVKKEFIDNLELIKAIVLIPIIVSIIEIDYKNKIIPNRLVLTLFECGLVFAFIYSINNVFMTRDYIIAMFIGAVLYGVIALMGKLIAGKDVMGMGDVKLLASLGLYFGIALTISISIISFIIAAILGIIFIIRKKGENTDYIPFGPAIGIAALLCIYIPESVIISSLLTVFTLGKRK